MASRESLINFIEGLTGVVSPSLVQVEYEEEINPMYINLNRLVKNRHIKSFSGNKYRLTSRLKKFFTDETLERKVANIVSIGAVVKSGTIRVPNPKYKQDQACTVAAFDMKFDMIPPKDIYQEEQYVLIKDLKFSRFTSSNCPRIPTLSLEKEWRENAKINWLF